MAKRGWKGDISNAEHSNRPQSFRDQKVTVKREFVAALANVSHMSVPEIALVAESNELPALHVLMGRIVLDAIEGDSHARTILLDRLFGKVADAMDVSHSMAIDPDLARIPEDKLIEILELSEATHDAAQEHDQSRADSIPRETDERESPGPQAGGIHHSSPGDASGHSSTGESQGDDGKTYHGGQRRYKGALMETRDAVLEAGRIAEEYQGDAAKKGR